MWLTNRRSEKYMFHCLAVSTFLVLLIVILSNSVSPFRFNIVAFLVSEFLKIVTSPIFLYMLVTLSFSLLAINKFIDNDVFLVRKLFHFTALAVFLPAILWNQKIMVFGSNIAIVLFVIVEFGKKFGKGTILQLIHEYEDRYLDEREKNSNNLILSHLCLLLGCSISCITSYILVDGMEFPPHFIMFSLSGLLFVGIGDSMAALGGRMYGKTMWPNRKKSQEGSFFCIASYLANYIMILLITQPLVTSGKGIEIFLAGFVATMVEAFTRQFDNFLCPQICFASLLYLNYYFEEYIPNF
mmetsp:Transcript_13534/g.12009  ORF Transcript_13534/g.12009 Transcript_13534/m.12009 type:complete len:298 (-) Transcript_13534:23-916(-)